jgi:predicted DNA-binding transcriptional regulator AlpA
METTDELLDIRAIAQAVGVTPRCIRQWVASGKFPAPIRFSNNVVRWSRSTLGAYLISKQQGQQ